MVALRCVRTVASGLLAATLALAGTGAVTAAAAPVTPAADTSTTDWPAYQRNPAHSSAIFGDPTITPANAGSLRQAWRFRAQAATQVGQPAASFFASPTVVGNRVYIGSRTGMFTVLDVTTGALVWKKQLDWGTTNVCTARGMAGTATVQPDPVDGALTVYVPGAHYLYALDAVTGATRWRRAIGPDTAAGRDRYFNWSSPTVAGGRVFMGLSSKCDSDPIRGGVVSVDQHTGVLLRTWYDMAAGHVGGSVWTSAASDGTTVWATTGNPDPNGTSIDDAYSIVRLDAATLTKQEKWTAPNAVASDLDFGTSPSLFAATIGGRQTLMVGACNKNGLFYAWRRTALAAGPVWSRRVGQTGGNNTGACLPSPAVDFQAARLFVASNTTTVGGVTVPGALRAVDPATGAVLWSKPLPCLPNGSPTVNGTVVAVPLWGCPDGVAPGVVLFRETNGEQLGRISTTGRVFAQAVPASGHLFVAADDGTLTAYRP